MNKIIYTLGFLLVFSFFNNEAKAQTADVAPCTKNASGAVVITTQISSTTDQTCDGEGATNLSLNIYSLGFCTSAPTVNFVDDGKEADERDSANGSYSNGASNFSSCIWTIKQSSATSESLSSVGAVEPLPSDEIPPKGTYTHAVIVISNEMTVAGSTTFSQTIQDTTAAANTGTKCWTNGTYFVDTGKQGPLIGSSVSNASTNKTGAAPLNNSVFSGGATCGSTPSPTATTLVSKYSNYEPAVSTGEACASAVDGGRTAGCNTTRSEENTAFGTLTVFFTTADISSLATDSPIIQRSKIVTTSNGTATGTNTLTGVFAYNTPMVVTDKTTGMEIFVNFNNALTLDFEPSRRNDEDGWTNTLAVTDNATPAAPPRIRSIQSGPFGIQFKATEGGGIN
jgi:hypothetical protein